MFTRSIMESDTSASDSSPRRRALSATSSDSEPEQPPVKVPRKSTKGQERTPAQKEATAKALAVLKERRGAKQTEDKERLEKASEAEKQRILAEKYEKQKQQRKKLPPAPSYVTLGDLETFKKDILGALPKEVYKAVEVVKEPKKPKAIEAPAPVIKERVVEKPIHLSGSALLDELLFRNRL